MKETRYFYVPDATLTCELPDEEVVHAIRVLRMKEGDEMMLMDGKGVYYKAEITSVSHRHCYYRILEETPQITQWDGHFHIGVAPTKMMERMEWMLEKVTEIGIDEISFLDCGNSERKAIKLSRVDKILVSAMKQSRKAWKPVLNDVTRMNLFIDKNYSGLKFIAHCYDDIPRTFLFDELRGRENGEHITVLIGPEGDFTIEEIKDALAHGYKSVHLGESRLRTETAGIAATMMMHLSANCR